MPDTDNTLITSAAKAVREISRITDGGGGNFNFTVNFNCDPFIPYFPAGYHDNSQGTCFVIGLETPDLLVRTLELLPKSQDHNDNFNAAYNALTASLQYHVDGVVEIVSAFDRTEGFEFLGIDSSAASFKDCASMVQVYELLGVEYFGAAGTVEASALMRDTGTLAHRLDKPLTVRLFPVPGLNPGDITAFESEDLCNCAVLAVP